VQSNLLNEVRIVAKGQPIVAWISKFSSVTFIMGKLLPFCVILFKKIVQNVLETVLLLLLLIGFRYAYPSIILSVYLIYFGNKYYYLFCLFKCEISKCKIFILLILKSNFNI